MQNMDIAAVLEKRKLQLALKRAMDIVISGGALAVLWPVLLLIAVAIKIDDPGPVFYRQVRVGKDGKEFRIFKFRTMVVDADKKGLQITVGRDNRITRMGRLLRKTKLDELAQLINVFVGEMSFVGPRPERACFYNEFEQYIPHFRQRLQVQPGLTGHAQVNGGYELKPEEKIVYDLEYIANRSVRMDLQCIWKTVLVVFSHDGAR